MEESKQSKSKVLIVEDSRTTVNVITRRLNQEEGFPYEVADSYAQAREMLAEDPLRFFIAVVDLQLLDAPNGEVVDYVISKGIPLIVLSAIYQEKVRGMMMDKAIVDYVPLFQTCCRL